MANATDDNQNASKGGLEDESPCVGGKNLDDNKEFSIESVYATTSKLTDLSL